VEVIGKQVAPFLSAGTHLVLAGLVALLTTWLCDREPERLNGSPAAI
jgi:hypothetical protein